MRRIAHETGLSVATVSRVLNGVPGVRPKTRDKVLAAVKRLGYVPNPSARALTTKRTRTIAAVIPTLAHSIFAKFLNAVEVELAAHGYALIVGTTNGDPALELKRVREMLGLGAEGAILSGVERSSDLMRLLQTHGLPAICTSIFDSDSVLETVGYDNAALGGLAVTHLRSLGHRRVAVIHGPTASNDRTRLRIKGVHDAGEPADLSFFETTLDVAGGVAATREAIARQRLPTALLCLSDILALGAMFELSRAGLNVPETVSVMGFDDLDWAQYCEPPLTTIDLPVVEMGRYTAASMVEHLDFGAPLVGRRLQAEIIVRDSTAPPRKTRA